ncbi:TetR/AcrR family transcriptional regulator [Ferrimonas lipolytica]|uniref:TetR/AcrR family transcriptional regulator n=1 Tax=Ferrimonas lipolytica TaxID=2724191 RepID=A0A6H1UDG7_9GAMM|nr:TetR/AcrR family transcriptional regulator [Ferrimonas lipolytica]QIZ76256.1 TetR/AcrR family transcriptional regulator [Ferrimonas lipolytica]
MSEQRIDLIVDAAERLIAQKGIFAFSLNELCQITGLSNGSLYRTVKNKDDIIAQIFLRVLNRYQQLDIAISRSNLNDREKFLCHFCYPFFVSAIYRSDIGINHLATNWGLIKHTQPRFLDEVRAAFHSLGHGRKRLMRTLLENDYFEADQTKLKKVVLQMHIISKGSSVVAANVFLPKSRLPIDEVIDYLEATSEQLQWHEHAPKVDRKALLATLRTLSDNNIRIVV